METQINLCLSDFTIRINEGAYKGCTDPMKGINQSYVKTPTKQFDDVSFGKNNDGKENDQIFDLSKITSDRKNLSREKQSMLCNVQTEYKLIFDGTIDTWKNNSVDI